MARRRKMTLSQRVVSAGTVALPGPVRSVATNRRVASLIVICLPILLAMGVVSLDWENGFPSFSFNHDRAAEVKREATEKLEEIARQRAAAAAGGGYAQAPAAGWGAPLPPSAAWPPNQAAPANYQAPQQPYPGGWGQPAPQPGWGYGQALPAFPQSPPPNYGPVGNAWQGGPYYR